MSGSIVMGSFRSPRFLPLTKLDIELALGKRELPGDADADELFSLFDIEREYDREFEYGRRFDDLYEEDSFFDDWHDDEDDLSPYDEEFITLEREREREIAELVLRDLEPDFFKDVS